ncbi:MAG: VOC family protein [Devosia sp.]|nr:VOC family protein [Devosia sp.]
MLTQIKGLHHVTAMARDAALNNDFFTRVLGLRRVKQTVNFDEPSVYHLYYGDAAGSPGTIMTHFPFPHIARGRPGTGEVGTTAFAVPRGSLGYWQQRLAAARVGDLEVTESFGETRLGFRAPEGDALALVEVEDDARTPWVGNGVGEAEAIRGVHSASLRVRDGGASEELLRFMGYDAAARAGGVRRLVRPEGNGADLIDIEVLPEVGRADLAGAGSVHHIAFAVADRAAQLAVRAALLDTGYQVTPVIDRDYFWAIYFRTPGGVLFEIATNEPGFDRDEDSRHLGETLRLPRQHEHLRATLERTLQPLDVSGEAA